MYDQKFNLNQNFESNQNPQIIKILEKPEILNMKRQPC